MFNLRTVMFAFVVLALLLLAGRYIKHQSRWCQRLYLPASIVAGVIGLLLGPEVLGAIVTAIAGEEAFLSGGCSPQTFARCGPRLRGCSSTSYLPRFF